MVCKECGSYNAENLSVCKECGAKLRDDDTTARDEEARNATEDGRPSREFVKAPSWPKSAYSGAPEKPISDTPVSSGSFRPTIPPRAAASAPAATCPHCGKPVISDAPFCAYCGQRIAGEPAPAAVSARPAAKPAPAPAPAPEVVAPVADGAAPQAPDSQEPAPGAAGEAGNEDPNVF